MASIDSVFFMNIDLLDVGVLQGMDIIAAGPTYYTLEGPTRTVFFQGVDFTYDANGQLAGGTITEIDWFDRQNRFDLSGLNLPVSQALGWFASGDTASALSTIFAGDDYVNGWTSSELIRGFDGNDTLLGSMGSDTIFGGTGDDIVSVAFPGFEQSGSTFLRGDDGNDTITGGAGFDNINGNVGNDSCSGGGGNDWVLGGQDNDLLTGGAGDDILNGNLGSDTVDGGTGNDIVRGGQADDRLQGGAGDDWISGDLGTDSLNGGGGADTFHFSPGSGADWIFDFKRAEGDRILLDPGMTWSANQQGADVILNLSGGGQVVLSGVQLSSLTSGWIVSG